MPTTPDSATESPLARLLLRDALPKTPWFAVVDATQDPKAPGHAAEQGLTVQSLYAGDLGAALDHVAPHLVAFPFEGPFARGFLDNWGRNIGILLQTKSSFAELRKHLRQFLLARDEAGKRYRFRFYDPRVLRAFLPACTGAEIIQFFGPVQSYYAATRDGKGVMTYRPSARGLAAECLEP